MDETIGEVWKAWDFEPKRPYRSHHDHVERVLMSILEWPESVDRASLLVWETLGEKKVAPYNLAILRRMARDAHDRLRERTEIDDWLREQITQDPSESEYQLTWRLWDLKWSGRTWDTHRTYVRQMRYQIFGVEDQQGSMTEMLTELGKGRSVEIENNPSLARRVATEAWRHGYKPGHEMMIREETKIRIQWVRAGTAGHYRRPIWVDRFLARLTRSSSGLASDQ